MPRLVLINGLPASGKSTLAARYAERHPLTLALEVDVVRAMLGDWLATPTEAGLLARRIAIEMARAHLAGGRDVLVPQYLGRPDFVLELAGLATEAEADFVETTLIIDAAEAELRFARRSADPARPADVDAARLAERNGTDFPGMSARLDAVLASRPSTIRIPAAGDIDRTYRALQSVVHAARAGVRIFHILDRDAWRAAEAGGEYRPVSLAEEGFVHFSFADQVAGTANRRHRDRTGLCVIEADAAALAAEVRVEDSYGTGTAFPHVYGPVPAEAVLAVHILGRDAGSDFTFSTDG